MSDTRKKEKATIGYEVVQIDGNKLKLIEGRYALSKEELDKLDNMIISVDGTYKIEKDDTGKIVRMDKNGKILSEISKEKYDKLFKKANKQANKQEQGR